MNQVPNKNSWNSIPSAPLYQLLALQLALTETTGFSTTNFPPPPAKSRKRTALVGIVWGEVLVGIVWGRSFSGNCLGKKF